MSFLDSLEFLYIFLHSLAVCMVSRRRCQKIHSFIHSFSCSARAHAPLHFEMPVIGDSPEVEEDEVEQLKAANMQVTGQRPLRLRCGMLGVLESQRLRLQ